MVRRLAAAAGAGALALFASARAEAAPILRVEWPRLPGCPDSVVVAERARLALAQAKQADDVLAIAIVTPPGSEGAPWRLHMRMRTVRGAGERSLEAPTCDALARAAGLLVALAALRTQAPEPEHPIEELAPAADRVEEPGPLVAPTKALGLPRRPGQGAPLSSTHGRFAVAAGAGVDVGLLPSLAAGPVAVIAYESRSDTARDTMSEHGVWSVRAAFFAALPQDERRSGGISGLGAIFSSVGGSVELCRRLPLPRLALAKTRACAGAEIDIIHASGRGGADTFDVRRTAVMAFAGAGADWELGRSFRVGLDTRFGVSLERPMFVVEPIPESPHVLHRTSLFRGQAALTLSFVF